MKKHHKLGQFSRLLGIGAFALVMSCASPALAAKWWHWIFPPDAPDFEKPYLYDGKTPHMVSWYGDESWQPEIWARERGGAQAVIEEFYRAGIITDRYEKDDIPVLEVGEGFMDLGDQDKLRVVAFTDYAFGLTDKTGTFQIRHEKRNDPVGIYTKGTLQLQ